MNLNAVGWQFLGIQFNHPGHRMPAIPVLAPKDSFYQTFFFAIGQVFNKQLIPGTVRVLQSIAQGGGRGAVSPLHMKRPGRRFQAGVQVIQKEDGQNLGDRGVFKTAGFVTKEPVLPDFGFRGPARFELNQVQVRLLGAFEL